MEGNIYWEERPKYVEVVNILVDGGGKSLEIIIFANPVILGKKWKAKGENRAGQRIRQRNSRIVGKKEKK